MSNNLSTTKSVLAKLLAGENLNIIHDANLQTAMFNMKTRTLYLPVYEVMDGELYDLLVGHEDGHALYTPNDGWHGAIEESNRDRGFKDALNVIEDARIEKLIKRKYPGLSRSFSNAYRGLYNRDFFGIKNLTDYNKLNLIDRINLYFKCGSFTIMPFSDDERKIVEEISGVETWEQVVNIAKRVYKKAQEEKQNQINDLKDLTEELLKKYEDSDEENESSNESDSKKSDDSDNSDNDEKSDIEKMIDEMSDDNESDEDSDESNNSAKSDENDKNSDASDKSDDSNEEDSDERGKSDKSDETEENDSDKSEKISNESRPDDESVTDSDDSEVLSVTDRTFREREKELIKGGTEIHNFTFPKSVLKNIIIPAKLITENFKEQNINPTLIKECVNRFNSTNNRYINLLIKEFEMRKNAGQFARTTTARTGELDMNKLHQYRYNNDLFRKISIVPKGKSHGIILFLDMSGSMINYFGPTVEQTLTLAVFCKRAGIPFDVYGFSDREALADKLIKDRKLPESFRTEKFVINSNDNYGIQFQGFNLMHMLSSNFSQSQYRESFELMCTLAINFSTSYRSRYINVGNNNYTNNINWTAAGFGLGSTPFTQTLIASRDIIENFKMKNGVDITNVIYMTDGDGTSCFNFPAGSYANRFFFTDEKTKERVEVSYYGQDIQQKITKFIRNLTDCKHIGFYLCGTKAYNRQFKYQTQQMLMSPDKVKLMQKESRNNDFFNVPHIGYDMYFYMLSHNTNIIDDDFEINDKMTNKRIAKSFIEAQEGKRRNRSLVSKFAKEIAES